MKSTEKKEIISIPKRLSDTGRSMVEMLGVLAVIAVLTIGGLMGYKMAMSKYKASKVINEINIARSEMQIAMSNGLEKIVLPSPFSEGTLNSSDKYAFSYDCGDGSVQGEQTDCSLETQYYFMIEHMEKDVCKSSVYLSRFYPSVSTIYVNEVEGGEELCTEEENSLLVVFDKSEGGGNSDEDDYEESPENSKGYTPESTDPQWSSSSTTNISTTDISTTDVTTTDIITTDMTTTYETTTGITTTYETTTDMTTTDMTTTYETTTGITTTYETTTDMTTTDITTTYETTTW